MKMSIGVAFVSLLLLPLVVICKENFIIAAYLPESSTHVNVTNAAVFLTDLILFSVQPTVAGSLEDCCLQSYQYELIEQLSNSTRIWVSIGGIGRSGAFPRLVTESEPIFLENLVEFCQQHRIKGVDLYWDDPKTKQDIDGYSRLIMDTADVLHRYDVLLSVTTRQFFPPHVIEKVDRFNLMAYDLTQGHKQHHAAMESVNLMVENLIYQGYPAHNIVLGIPAYARHRDDPNNVRTFAELVDDGYRELGKSNYKGYLFDSPGRVKRKIKFAKENKLGGVFIWHLGQDTQVQGAPGGMLLEAAAMGEYTLLDEL